MAASTIKSTDAYLDNTAPSACNWGSWSTSYIKSGGTATITLTCADANSGIDMDLATSDVTVSGTNLGSITAVSKGGTDASRTYTFTLTGGSASGTPTVSIAANKVHDKAGNNFATAKTSGSIIVDVAAPTLAVSVPNGTTYEKTKTATVTISDSGGSGLSNTAYTIRYVWSTSNVTTCNSTSMPNTITITPTAGAASATGTISLSSSTGAGKIYICNAAAITDRATNSLAASTITSADAYLDNTAPNCTWGAWPYEYVSGDGTAAITLTCTDSHSGVTMDLSSSAATLTNPSVATIGTPTKSGTNAGRVYVFTLTGGSVSGSTTITLLANVLRDAAGNYAATTTAANSVFFDIYAPTLSVNVINGTQYAREREAVISIAEEEGGSGLAPGTYTIKYAWGTSPVSCSAMTSTVEITVSNGAEMGSETVTIQGQTGAGKIYVCNQTDIIDRAGNMLVGDVQSADMYLDNIPPTITLPTDTPIYIYKYDATSFASYASATDTGGSGLSSFTGSVGNATTAENAPLGANTISFAAVDGAGNVSSANLPVIIYAKINCALDGMVEDPTDASRCIFRGSDPNNWLRFNGTYTSEDDLHPTGGTLFRIIGNEIVYKNTTDTVYAGKIVHSSDLNATRVYGTGTNRAYYTNSSLRTYLMTTYAVTLNGYASNQMQSAIFYDGSVSTTNTVTVSDTVTSERNKIATITSTVGLPNVYDFLLASTNCNGSTTWQTVKAKTCDANNWMVYTTASRFTWFISHTSASNATQWLSPGQANYSSYGPVLGTGAENSGQVRPTIYLKNSVIIIGGTGTQEDPYLLAANKNIDSSEASCTVTTTPGFEVTKTLTVNIENNGVSLAANPISWTSATTGFGTSTTYTATAAGTYYAYIKDSGGQVSKCGITLVDREEYRPTVCNSVNYTNWTFSNNHYSSACNEYTYELSKKVCDISNNKFVGRCTGSNMLPSAPGSVDQEYATQDACISALSTYTTNCLNAAGTPNVHCYPGGRVYTRTCSCDSLGQAGEWQTTPLESTCSTIVDERITIGQESESSLVCTWGSWSESYIDFEETSTITLTCTDNEADIQTMTFTPGVSNSSVGTVGTPVVGGTVSERTFTFTFTAGTTAGSTTLTVLPGTIVDANGNSATTTTSSPLQVGVLVTLDANGGSIPTSTNWNGSGAIATKNLTLGSQYGALPAMSRNGYAFLGWAKATNRIPAAYQEVEYLENTGGQYIDTGYLPSNNTRTEVVYSVDTYDAGIFGELESSKQYGLVDASYNNYKMYYYFGANNAQSSQNVVLGQIYTAVINGNTATLNETDTITPTNNTFTSTKSVHIFGFNRNGNEFNVAGTRVYSLKIYEGINLLHDYIPCYRVSDGEIGMYDRVGEVFYPNAGTGTFGIGPVAGRVDSTTTIESTEDHTLYAKWIQGFTVTFNAAGGTIPSGSGWTGSGSTATKTAIYNQEYGSMPLPTRDGYSFAGWSYYNGYQQVEYIASTGTQYINTGIKGSCEFDLDFQPTANDADGTYYFGQRQNGSTIRFALMKYNSGFHFMTGANDMWNGTYNTNRHFIKFTSSNAYIDSIRYAVNFGSGSAGTSLNFMLFAADYNGSMKYNGGMRIYSAKFYQNSSTVRDFVPSVRVSDSAIGLYDAANNVFYPNAGSGTFNKGANHSITSTTYVEKTENHTLYALWRQNFTVTLDPSGGTVSPTSKSVGYGIPYGELPTPTKAGYDFMGWSTTQYPQLDYIAATGTQYINSGYLPNASTGIVANYQYTSTNVTNQQALFGTQNSSTIFYRFYLNGSNQWAYAFQNGSGNWISTEIAANTSRHTLQFNRSGKVKLDSSYNQNITGTVSKTATNPLYIFANDNAGNPAMYSKVKIYSFKIYNGSTLDVDFIAAQRATDGVLGLYDTINGTFYTNAGSDKFTKGTFSPALINEDSIVSIDDNHTLYAVWEKSIPKCTITTTAGYDTSKELTINAVSAVPLAADAYSWDNSTWTSTNTKTVSSAATYRAYVRDTDGEVGTCTLQIKSRTEYRKRTCSGDVNYGSWTQSGSGYTTSNCQAYTYETSKRECPGTYTNVCDGSVLTTGSSYTKCWQTDRYYCDAGINLSVCYPEYVNYTRTCSCSAWGSWSAWGTTQYSDSCSVDAATRTAYGT